MQLIVNLFYTLVGIVFLLLSKVKVRLRGYYTPKPFGSDEWERCANYDISVVDNWLRHLAVYTHGELESVAKKSICELGPGSDLGTGLYLLSKQAAQYVAVDVNDMVTNAPDELYDALFSLIASRNDSDIHVLRSELRHLQDGAGQRLRFMCSPSFDLAASVEARSIDLVFSQAAFEHFDEIGRFVRDLDSVVKPGAILIAEVDLRTHSRWIRDKDELNIYRYSDRVYKLLRCSGSPNRIRPYQYREAFERCGWTNVRTKPLTVLNRERFSAVRHSLAKQFRGDHNQMEQLTIMLLATKGTAVASLE
jgi:SAM-dependent methyltransferase